MNALRRQDEIRRKKIVAKCVAWGRFSEKGDKHFEKESQRCPTCKSKFNAWAKKKNCSVCAKVHCEDCLRVEDLRDVDEYPHICRLCAPHLDAIKCAVGKRKRNEFIAASRLQSLARGVLTRKQTNVLLAEYRRQKEEKENRAIRAEAFRLNTEATLRRLRRAKVKKEIALVVCIVNQNIDNVRVVEMCCDTFAALACLAECKLKVLKGGAIDATLLAMKRFESELKVQESGALAIAFAMHNSPLNKIACFERGCVDLLLDLTETFPASSVIQRARSIIFDDFHRLQLHPTDQKLRDLGRDATALIRSATERRSLLHLFCFDLNTVERDIWRVRSITAKDVIACRRFFAQGNGRLLQNVRDFELRVNNLIAPRKCSRKQLYDMVALTKCGTSKTKRESKKRNVDVGKNNEMVGGAFDCEVFVRRMTSAAKPLAPQWARLLMLRILLRENARS